MAPGVVTPQMTMPLPAGAWRAVPTTNHLRGTRTQRRAAFSTWQRHARARPPHRAVHIRWLVVIQHWVWQSLQVATRVWQRRGRWQWLRRRADRRWRLATLAAALFHMDATRLACRLEAECAAAGRRRVLQRAVRTLRSAAARAAQRSFLCEPAFTRILICALLHALLPSLALPSPCRPG